MKNEILERALKAVETVRTHANDHLSLDSILDAVRDALDEEFTISNDWCAEEHKGGVWSVRNLRTGDQYRAKARGNATRLVVFMTKEKADAEAYRRNVAEGRRP